MEPAAEEAPAPAPAVNTAAAAEAPREATAEDSCNSPASPSTDNERQIPVDPVSLRHLGMVAHPDSPLSAPSVLTEMVVQSSPHLPPIRRPTFVGASLPCSATSSPVHSATAKRDEPAKPASHAAAATDLRSLARQHSVALARFVAGPAAPAPALSRSASRAEGRSMAPHDDESAETDAVAAAEDSFTCGALCMFIPGFSKKKPAAAAVVSRIQRLRSGSMRRSSVSRVASLERFECGSWSPPPPVSVAAAAPHEADRALEVAKISCADDSEAPVKMAFVFDGETRGILKKSASTRPEQESATPRAFGLDGEPRGILKKSASTRPEQDSAPRASSASQRHVRFLTAGAAASCPSSPCITPRLMKARADFNAFVEAQSA